MPVLCHSDAGLGRRHRSLCGHAGGQDHTRFGKNRPFIVIGNITLFCDYLADVPLCNELGTGIRLIAFILIYLVYILGYTAQCVVTKSAQTCLTNDPKQRPVFAMFDTVYNLLSMSVIIPVYVSGTLIPRYTITSATAEGAAQIEALVAKFPGIGDSLTVADGITTLSGFYNPEMFRHLHLVLGSIAAVFAVCGIIGLWRKDRLEYFGTGKVQKGHFPGLCGRAGPQPWHPDAGSGGFFRQTEPDHAD